MNECPEVEHSIARSFTGFTAHGHSKVCYSSKGPSGELCKLPNEAIAPLVIGDLFFVEISVLSWPSRVLSGAPAAKEVCAFYVLVPCGPHRYRILSLENVTFDASER